VTVTVRARTAASDAGRRRARGADRAGCAARRGRAPDAGRRMPKPKPKPMPMPVPVGAGQASSALSLPPHLDRASEPNVARSSSSSSPLEAGPPRTASPELRTSRAGSQSLDIDSAIALASAECVAVTSRALVVG
jgi:hypothetical protein